MEAADGSGGRQRRTQMSSRFVTSSTELLHLRVGHRRVLAQQVLQLRRAIAGRGSSSSARTRRTKTSIEQNRTNDNICFCTAVHTGLLNQSVLKPAV